MAPAVKRLGCLICGIMLAALSAQSLQAQDRTSRVELSRADLTGATGTEVIMATLEIQPGGTVPRHFHNGDEFLYVLGGATVQAPEHDPVTFDAGMSLHFPREVPHGGFTVIGDDSLKVLTVHIVDKDKPLVEPVR